MHNSQLTIIRNLGKKVDACVLALLEASHKHFLPGWPVHEMNLNKLVCCTGCYNSAHTARADNSVSGLQPSFDLHIYQAVLAHPKRKSC